MRVLFNLRTTSMQKLEKIAEQIRQTFDAQTAARDQALAQARALTRACALSIRAVHRDETDVMQAHLDEARQLADTLRTDLADFPALYFAGYTQDSLKEFAEASITCALIRHQAAAHARRTRPAAQYLPERAGRERGRNAPPLPGYAAPG